MSMEKRERVLIIGAAGRDFHVHNVLFRDDPTVQVVAFTAAQIPRIDGRRYPAVLAGPHYGGGIPIIPEAGLEAAIREERAGRCVLAYSDLSHGEVMALAARCLAAGAAFALLPPRATWLRSCKPVVAVTAVRTGCGKSQVARYVSRLAAAAGLAAAVVRHPMPYGDLAAQAVQRFGSRADLDAAGVTVEEREEYEQHVDAGAVVFAGVDYAAILAAAEAEADVIIWDGGNNDGPFYRPDLHICVADPHRAGAEAGYHPGDVNFRAADVIVINKANTAEGGAVARVRAAAAALNPRAPVVATDSVVTVAGGGAALRGKRVVLVEDGPTLTHGGMAYGAGRYAAQQAGAEVVDARPHLVGSLADTLAKYPHLGEAIPAMGYFPQQVRDLEASIAAAAAAARADAVLVATPVDLAALICLRVPCVRVAYEVRDREGEPALRELLAPLLARASARGGGKQQPNGAR